jgi:nitrite reductase/ring-hydroxylating ferredoxin subunit/uncharacterized membrane protein
MATAHAKVRDLGGEAVERLERQDWLEPLADGLQRAIAAVFAAGGSAGRRVRDALHGTWLGHPLHPVLTDVPLGAWTVAATIDLLSADGRGENRAADTAVALGLAGAAGAAVTGLTDWHHTAGGARRVGLMHGLLNVSATAMYAVSLALRVRGDRRAAKTIGGVGLGVALAAAYLGGHLVFRKRIGVDHAPRVEWDDFVAVLAESALAESTVRRVEVRGVPLVLIRKGGRVHALADQCAHLGGPLSEGSLDEVSIRCPWHGSRFALEDGAVLEGPSTFPQACFEVRARGGQIEVRPRG